MDTEHAEQLGRAARDAGRGNHPVAEPAIAAELMGAFPGEKTYLMAAFNRGWQARHHELTDPAPFPERT